jgi:hypothetical protein
MRTMDYNRLTKILHSNIDQTGKKETLSFLTVKHQLKYKE